MRILIATTHRNLIGGIERYLQILIPGLLQRGHDVALLYEKHLQTGGETIDSAGACPSAWCASDTMGALAAAAEWRPEIVYSQGLEDGQLERALLAAYPAVLYAHNYYGSCISGRKCHSFPAVQPCSRTFGPGCLLLYYPRRCGGLNPATMWRMFQSQSQLNARLSGHQAVLVASRHMLREMRTNGVPADQVHLVPLPAAERSLQVAPDRKGAGGNVLFIGRVTDIKGVHYLVKALPQAAAKLGRPLRLTIAGDGPELPKIRALAETLGLQVDYAGWAGNDKLRELISDADLLAVPSLWPEPFGLVGVEAGSLGLPAVGYALGGIPDWLIPGVTGELAAADPPTSSGLAAAVVRALADADHYQKLCQGAWEMAQQFTWDAHLTRLEPLLARCGVEDVRKRSAVLAH
jgi:glycosyltransferase involved in cell wall biosynthesis